MDWFLYDNGLRHEGVKKHGVVYCLSRVERAVFQYPKLCDFAITSFRNISQSFRKLHKELFIWYVRKTFQKIRTL